MWTLSTDQLLAIALRTIGDGVISCDRDGLIVLINAEAEILTGWSQAEAIGKRLKELFVIINETTRQPVESPAEQVFRLGAVVGITNHTLLLRRDQTEIAIDHSASPIYDDANQLHGAVMVFRDVTERRRAERNLKLLAEELVFEKARLAAVLESVPVGVLVADSNGKILLGNSELDRVLCRPLQPADSIADYGSRFAMDESGKALPPEQYPMARAIQKRETLRNEELLYQRGDGSSAWISVSSTPVIDPSGELLGGVVTVADIDAQRKARELLARSEERFRLLIENASVGVNIGDENGTLSYVNPSLLKLIGYTEEEVKRGEVRWDQLTPPKYADADRNALEQLRSTGVARPYEKAYRAKDGQLVPMLLGAAMIPSLKGGPENSDIAVFFTDLTTQKRAEAALFQSEKLAAVGKLATSISHEINNPLEAVTNILYIVRNDPTLSQQTKDFLETADRELARVSQVTSQTLRFHRQPSFATDVKPDALVEEVLRLYVTRMANSRVHVSRDYTPGLTMTCYEGDMRQVLNNLVGNAFDAMRARGGGHLTIRTRYATRWSTGEPGVHIAVADTGTGISPETLAHIFEAFYTTKGNAGTGLGLWISSRIVHKHRGYIRAYSSMNEKTHGTVFLLWLPNRLAGTASEPWHLEDGKPV